MNGEWQVTSHEQGLTLLAFLKEKLPQYSARQLKRLLEANLCQVNGRIERFATTALGTGDTVKLLQKNELQKTKKTLFDKERVLYEDDDLFIYNKPSGVSSEADAFVKSLQRNLPFLAPVHRLDRDTTGVLIFVKNRAAKTKMENLFKTHQMRKSYLAIVDGVIEKKHGTIDNQLGVLHKYEGQAIWGAVPKGLRAITDWVCLETSKNASLVRCNPKTGRTHQLRVHLSSMGHPILGDAQYGRQFKCNYHPERFLLHAEKIEFPYCKTNEILTITAPFPEDFVRALATLFGIMLVASA